MNGKVHYFEINGKKQKYVEYDKGRFESVLTKDGKAIAHTNGDRVIIEDLTESEAVNMWANFYDLEVSVSFFY